LALLANGIEKLNEQLQALVLIIFFFFPFFFFPT